MNRLQQELQRLYGAQAEPEPDADPAADAPAAAAGRGQAAVRAMVLELARPSDWAALSAVWAGVQADLALPAPAIAVNGSDGCQLWFSLQEPVAVPRAGAFLDALRQRYLGDVAPARVALLPAPHAEPDGPPRPARPVPALQADSGQWSAFVTHDLVPMFTDEPKNVWLSRLDGGGRGRGRCRARCRSGAGRRRPCAREPRDSDHRAEGDERRGDGARLGAARARRPAGKRPRRQRGAGREGRLGRDDQADRPGPH